MKEGQKIAINKSKPIPKPIPKSKPIPKPMLISGRINMIMGKKYRNRTIRTRTRGWIRCMSR